MALDGLEDCSGSFQVALNIFSAERAQASLNELRLGKLR
jgi:hypothetical protein